MLKVGFKNNGAQNLAFLNTIDSASREEFVKSIAEHYGTSVAVIETEVSGEDAYWLPEYMVEPQRSHAYALMASYSYKSISPSSPEELKYLRILDTDVSSDPIIDIHAAGNILRYSFSDGKRRNLKLFDPTGSHGAENAYEGVLEACGATPDTELKLFKALEVLILAAGGQYQLMEVF